MDIIINIDHWLSAIVLSIGIGFFGVGIAFMIHASQIKSQNEALKREIERLKMEKRIHEPRDITADKDLIRLARDYKGINEVKKMAHYQVTVDRDLLQGLFVRDDSLARLVENIVNQILDAQAAEQLKAKPYERTEEHQGYRNGHRDKVLKSRVGELALMLPRLRRGYFFNGAL